MQAVRATSPLTHAQPPRPCPTGWCQLLGLGLALALLVQGWAGAQAVALGDWCFHAPDRASQASAWLHQAGLAGTALAARTGGEGHPLPQHGTDCSTCVACAHGGGGASAAPAPTTQGLALALARQQQGAAVDADAPQPGPALRPVQARAPPQA
jgi:hypothetical protein